MIAVALAWLKRLAPLLFLALVAVIVIIAMASMDGCSKRAAAVEGAKATGAAEIAKAGDKASSAAVEAVAGYGDREADRQSIEQENHDAILSAPDAGASAGAAGSAGSVGLCKRAIYRDHPRCAGLRRPDTAPASR